jgi:hypothetical protein
LACLASNRCGALLASIGFGVAAEVAKGDSQVSQVARYPRVAWI